MGNNDNKVAFHHCMEKEPFLRSWKRLLQKRARKTARGHEGDREKPTELRNAPSRAGKASGSIFGGRIGPDKSRLCQRYKDTLDSSFKTHQFAHAPRFPGCGQIHAIYAPISQPPKNSWQQADAGSLNPRFQCKFFNTVLFKINGCPVTEESTPPNAHF